MVKLMYDQLFSIRIRHDYIDGPCTDLAIRPTKNCLKNLANHGLIFKQLSDGGVVLFTKNEDNSIPNKIRSLTIFQFILTVKNTSFENFTNLPYPPNKLGKKVFYFSNVSSTGGLNSATTLAKSTGNKIGNSDYSWLVNSTLALALNGQFSKINLSQIIPGAGKQLIKSFDTTGLQNLVIDPTNIDNLPNPPIHLQPGNYILDFIGASPKTEQIYLADTTLDAACWSIVDIVSDSTLDYTARTEYTLTAKANPWSYYLIDSANKVTINNNALANLSTATTGLAGLALSWVQEADIDADTYEQRQYALLKQRNPGKRLFLLRSNRSMPRSAESTVTVKLTLDGVQQTLPNPVGTQSKSDRIQTL